MTSSHSKESLRPPEPLDLEVVADADAGSSEHATAAAAAAGVQEAVQRAAARELALIRTSFATQPQYFMIPFAVVHDGGAIVVVDKPFDLQISHGANQQPRFAEEVTVAELTERVLGGYRHSYSRCHNLDFATSGLLVLATTKDGLRAGMQAFATDGVVEKEYLAVVLGWSVWSDNSVTPVPAANLLGDADGLLPPLPRLGATGDAATHRGAPDAVACCVLLLYFYADVRSTDDVIALEGPRGRRATSMRPLLPTTPTHFGCGLMRRRRRQKRRRTTTSWTPTLQSGGARRGCRPLHGGAEIRVLQNLAPLSRRLQCSRGGSTASGGR